MFAVEKLIQAGANAVKLEGLSGNEHFIKHIIESGIPVQGHLGLTPQSIQGLGGHKVQGKQEAQAQKIINDAIALENLGAFSIVLECVPATLAERIAQQLEIPVIGIGAGVNIDGQVLVLQDMLGMDKTFRPTFLKHFSNGQEAFLTSINEYTQEVRAGLYPQDTHTYQ